ENGAEAADRRSPRNGGGRAGEDETLLDLVVIEHRKGVRRAERRELSGYSGIGAREAIAADGVDFRKLRASRLERIDGNADGAVRTGQPGHRQCSCEDGDPESSQRVPYTLPSTDRAPCVPHTSSFNGKIGDSLSSFVTGWNGAPSPPGPLSLGRDGTGGDGRG